MALTDRAIQAVQAPLRLVQQATGTDTRELRSEIERIIRPLRQDIQDLDDRLEVLEEIDQRLTTVESKLDEIRDDTQHIRTEQASEQADGQA